MSLNFFAGKNFNMKLLSRYLIRIQRPPTNQKFKNEWHINQKEYCIEYKLVSKYNAGLIERYIPTATLDSIFYY